MLGCPQAKECVGTRDLALPTCPPTVDARNREIRWAHQESAHLVVQQATGVTPPDGLGFDRSGQSGELLNTWWRDSATVAWCIWRANSSSMIVTTARTLSGLRHSDVVEASHNFSHQLVCAGWREEHWHQGVAMFSSLTLRDLLGVPQLVPPRDTLKETRKNNVQKVGSDLRFPFSRGLQRERSWRSDRTPNPIDCHNSGVGVLVGESLQDVCHTLTTGLCRQGVLERGSGRLSFRGKLFCDGSGL